MPDPIAPEAPPEPEGARTRVGRMLAEQPYGVLCTQADLQPYGSLVAFAASADLRQVVFATPKETRKYRLLCACPNAALLIDTRCSAAGGLMAIEAVTATGSARPLAPGADFDRYAALLLAKHPALEGFVLAESSALFVVDIEAYHYVSRFQQACRFEP